MFELEEKIQQIERLHNQYVAELQEIEQEQRQAILGFLESVKEKRIAELKQQILNSQNYA